MSTWVAKESTERIVDQLLPDNLIGSAGGAFWAHRAETHALSQIAHDPERTRRKPSCGFFVVGGTNWRMQDETGLSLFSGSVT